MEIRGRRSGNTTRIVDECVQNLFDKKECIIEDHYKLGQDRRSNETLLEILLLRLNIEHGLRVGVDIEINHPSQKRPELWIKLIEHSHQ